MNKNIFKQGNTVEFAGQKWNVLAEVEENNFLCVSDDTIDYKPFDKDNNNNWSVSSLRKYLNGEYLQKFSGLELIPWTQDLTSDDGLKDYGSSTDLIFLLTGNQYRQYRQYMRKIDDWWWLITADSPINHYARSVLLDASLGTSNACYGRYGVRPACVIHLKSREEKEMKSYENGYKKMNKQIIKDAIKFHGADEQTTVCMEECAELIQAISKEKRGKHDKQHLIEEMADVYICLEMLMEIYNISSKEIESMIERKQQREIERMREQKW